MYKLILKNNRGEIFNEFYENPYLLRQRTNKINRGKSLIIIGVIRIDE
jgi:hypothetical protein